MSDGPTLWLLVLALAFAVVNGLNDGATMTASSLKAPGLRPVASVLILGAGVALVPLVIGTAVAQTLRSGLVDAAAVSPQLIVAIGVIGAMLVATILARRGLPTSLTLAVVGGIIGAGIGLGGDPRWPTVAQVILIGLAAPIVGGVVARLLVDAPLLHSRRSVGAAHRWGMVVQGIAYAANDGQKMVAVAIVAVGASSAGQSPRLSWWLTSSLAVAFMVGTVLGLRPMAASVSSGVLSQRPRHDVVVEYASGAAVLASAALGAPVSMTQSIVGGQVGVGVHQGYRRVRWRIAAQVFAAWIVTLPVAGLVSCAAAALVSVALGEGSRS